MSEFEHMEKLRLENKKLLERLKVKQGEFGGMDPGKRKSYLQSALGSANYADKLLDQGNNRQRKQFMKEVKKPKSILITPLKDDTKEAAAFLSSPKEVSVPLDSWAVRPLLGYDWIAGLLDMDSSLSEKSEQFFSELHEFRQVNRNECVQDLLTSEILDISAEEDHKEISLNSHPCVYCYRVNKRLFLNPVSSESCPVCKTKRNQQHWTVGEEAYVRVSLPKSTLLPPYKYKVHRRKSFDAMDSLALLPHCSAGWESSTLCNDTILSSLDLRTLVEPRTAVRDLHNHSHLELFSRVEGSSRLDQL